jgi:hypothetical protein
VSKRDGKASGGGQNLGISALAWRPALPAVNLLPPSVGEAAATRALQAKGLAALVLVVLLIGGGYAGLLLWKAGADGRVEAAELEKERLASERKQYAELMDVNEQLEQAEAARVAATAYELRWSELLQVMVDTRPTGSLVNAISGLGMSASQPIAASNNPLAPAGVGRLALELRVAALVDTGSWLRTLDATPGLEMAHCSSMVRVEGEEPGSVVGFDVTCSAEVNLLGLTGKGLPDEFNEWRDTTAAEMRAGGSAEGADQ